MEGMGLETVGSGRVQGGWGVSVSAHSSRYIVNIFSIKQGYILYMSAGVK